MANELVIFNVVKNQSTESHLRPKLGLLRNTIAEFRGIIADTLQIDNNEFQIFYDWNKQPMTLLSDADLMCFSQIARSTAGTIVVTVKVSDTEIVPIDYDKLVCGECNTNICGFRYKCMECPKFYMCKRCENEGRHSDHLMVRISKPSDFSKAQAHCAKSNKLVLRQNSVKPGLSTSQKSIWKQYGEQSAGDYNSSDPCTITPCMKESPTGNHSRGHHYFGHHGRGHRARGRHGYHNHDDRTAHSTPYLAADAVNKISNDLINGIGSLFADVIMGNSVSHQSQHNVPDTNPQTKPTEANSTPVAPEPLKENAPRSSMLATPVSNFTYLSGSGESSCASVVIVDDMPTQAEHESADVNQASNLYAKELEPTALQLFPNTFKRDTSYVEVNTAQAATDVPNTPAIRLFREMGFTHDETYLNNLLRRYDQGIAQVVKHLVENNK